MIVVVGAGGGGATILIHAVEKPQTCILRLEEKQGVYFISIQSFQVFMVLVVSHEQRHNIHQNINELLPQYSFF